MQSIVILRHVFAETEQKSKKAKNNSTVCTLEQTQVQSSAGFSINSNHDKQAMQKSCELLRQYGNVWSSCHPCNPPTTPVLYHELSQSYFKGLIYGKSQTKAVKSNLGKCPCSCCPPGQSFGLGWFIVKSWGQGQGPTLGPVGTGDWDLDFGLTINVSK